MVYNKKVVFFFFLGLGVLGEVTREVESRVCLWSSTFDFVRCVTFLEWKKSNDLSQDLDRREVEENYKWFEKQTLVTTVMLSKT